MIRTDMTNEQYHAHEAISSSDVKAVSSTSLLHWKNKVYRRSAAFDLGTAVHALVLEADEDLVVRGPADRRGNKWKEALTAADLNGQLLLTEADYDVAHDMAESILSTDVGKRMHGNTTVNEMSVFVRDDAHGLDLKTRPDSYWEEQGVIYDIKTTQDASPAGFAREVQKYNYAIQAAFYMHCLRLAGKPAKNFVFVCVEKQPPYATCTHILSPEYIKWAEAQMSDVLHQIKTAQDDNDFSTGWPVVNVIDLPRWLQDAPESSDDFN